MKTPSLDDRERSIAKRLLGEGQKYQDVLQLINTGRKPSVNPGRLAGYDTWETEPATDDQLERFRYEKSLVDLRTGLSPFDDERLFRAREAMIAAVQIFNSPAVLFKLEMFPVLSQIAWTYLLHEYYDRRGEDIEDDDGNTLLLSQMIRRDDCPVKGDIVKNLKAVKKLRDDVEHKTLNSLGRNFWSLFQANCLNFDKTIRQLFGEDAGLNEVLPSALQFSRMDVSGLANAHKYDLTPEIEAIDDAIADELELDGREGINYKFKVNYSFEKATKGEANIVFKDKGSKAKAAHTILTKKVVGDDLWPHKAMRVVALVNASTDQTFNSHHHQLAWKKYGARPYKGAKNPSDTKKDFAHYHAAHKDYTYSDKWVEYLKAVVADDVEFGKLKKFRPKS